jgi:hypothetical protein
MATSVPEIINHPERRRQAITAIGPERRAYVCQLFATSAPPRFAGQPPEAIFSTILTENLEEMPEPENEYVQNLIKMAAIAYIQLQMQNTQIVPGRPAVAVLATGQQFDPSQYTPAAGFPPVLEISEAPNSHLLTLFFNNARHVDWVAAFMGRPTEGIEVEVLPPASRREHEHTEWKLFVNYDSEHDGAPITYAEGELQDILRRHAMTMTGRLRLRSDFGEFFVASEVHVRALMAASPIMLPGGERLQVRLNYALKDAGFADYMAMYRAPAIKPISLVRGAIVHAYAGNVAFLGWQHTGGKEGRVAPNVIVHFKTPVARNSCVRAINAGKEVGTLTLANSS